MDASTLCTEMAKQALHLRGVECDDPRLILKGKILAPETRAADIPRGCTVLVHPADSAGIGHPADARHASGSQVMIPTAYASYLWERAHKAYIDACMLAGQWSVFAMDFGRTMFSTAA
eukprot:TRINITY_DN74672_c0_g1_i1.p3 TRINITY_DN74672_c0_g1~~TRINITY_DN74672_c0_g1_i1.p3  ORF type:complete len:138 (+),score=28.57 TRINITY_DN74672_c0_g1_i1:61-414(+)